jgi:ABC-2 type transport system permease protein
VSSLAARAKQTSTEKGTARPGTIGLLTGSAARVGSIAGWELRSLFQRPSTYVLLLTAALTAGGGFSWLVTLMARGGGVSLRQVDDPIVQFLGPNVFLVGLCTLLVPLLTMSLVADERRRGTWELLLTTPVSVGEVLIGKFLAGWSMLMLALLPWSYSLAVLRFWNGRTRLVWGFVPWFDGAGVPFDFGPVLGGTFGLAMIGGTFVALGLAASSVCRRPVSAALLTFMGMLLALVLGFAPRVLETWGFAREQLGWVEAVSCWGQLERSARGVLLPRVLVVHLSVWVGLFWLVSRLSRRVDDA